MSSLAKRQLMASRADALTEALYDSIHRISVEGEICLRKMGCCEGCVHSCESRCSASRLRPRLKISSMGKDLGSTTRSGRMEQMGRKGPPGAAWIFMDTT